MQHKEIEVPRGGCAIANASFETNAQIPGRVFDSTGKPASGTRLDVGELRTRGKVGSLALRSQYSDGDGKFTVASVPIGNVVLAANLHGAPTASMPFDACYAPGIHNALAARVFKLKPNQQVRDVSLRLPKPLPFGDLYVDVKWPDGSPASGGARAFAEWAGSEAASQDAPRSTNRVQLRLALKRSYAIKVDWIDAKPGKFLFVEGAKPETIDFTRDGQTVELRSKSKHPP